MFHASSSNGRKTWKFSPPNLPRLQMGVQFSKNAFPFDSCVKRDAFSTQGLLRAEIIPNQRVHGQLSPPSHGMRTTVKLTLSSINCFTSNAREWHPRSEDWSSLAGTGSVLSDSEKNDEIANERGGWKITYLMLHVRQAINLQQQVID